MVEHRGFEPLTSSMPWKRATNCANAPQDLINTTRDSSISLIRTSPTMVKHVTPHLDPYKLLQHTHPSGYMQPVSSYLGCAQL